MWWLLVGVGICALCMVSYSLCVVAKRADEQTERWRKQR